MNASANSHLTRMTTQATEQGAAEAAARAAARAAEAAAQAGQQAAAQAAREAERASRDIEQAIRDAQGAVDRAGRTAQPEGWGPQFPPMGPPIPEAAVVISLAFFAMCAVIAIGYPLARAFGRRADRKAFAAPGADADMRSRLERIEHAVDAIAVEVERISEGQRFTTRVLADLRALPEPDSAALAGSSARAREQR